MTEVVALYPLLEKTLQDREALLRLIAMRLEILETECRALRDLIGNGTK